MYVVKEWRATNLHHSELSKTGSLATEGIFSDFFLNHLEEKKKKIYLREAKNTKRLHKIYIKSKFMLYFLISPFRMMYYPFGYVQNKQGDTSFPSTWTWKYRLNSGWMGLKSFIQQQKKPFFRPGGWRLSRAAAV